MNSYFSCLPLLEKANNAPEDPSRVIIVGSASGMTEGGYLAYRSSKAAVHSLAMNLAVYLT